MYELNIPDGLPSLSRGGHEEQDGQACVMELVALLSGEEWTDNPENVHPILRAIAMTTNDWLPDQHRHLLNPLISWFFSTNDHRLDGPLCEYIGANPYDFDEDFDDIGSVVADARNVRFPEYAELEVQDIDKMGEPAAKEYSEALVNWLAGALDVADEVLIAHIPHEFVPYDFELIEKMGIK